MANQYSIADPNRIPAQLVHSGTANSAETIRRTGQANGAANSHITGGTVSAQSSDYITYMDETTTANTTYVGKAETGSSGTASVWQIKKIDETGVGTTLITFAGTTTSFNQVWNNRASLGYG